ncbi:MAG: MASE1 domain-containing protein [Idiomarina sp.]|nr:MASE1 domain-containing protein [Idiomarina sp.]
MLNLSWTHTSRSEGDYPWMKWLAIGVLLLSLAEWSRHFTINGAEFSAIWPPAGIFLGAVLALGSRAFIVLLPVMLLWSLIAQDMPWQMSLMGTLGLGVGTWIAATLIARSKKEPDPLNRLNYLPNLYVKGALIGSGISAFIGAVGYTWSMAGASEFDVQDIWLVYWLFEGLGVILFAPLFLMLFRDPRSFGREILADFKLPRIQVWLFLTVIALVLSVVMSRFGDDRYAPIFAFSLFPLICWFAVEGRASNLHLLIPTFAGIFVYFSIYNFGGLPPVEDFMDLLRVLLQVGILSVMAQLVGAINRQRTSLLNRFRDQAQQDFLTGLANDRGMNGALQHAIQQGQKSGTPWLMYIQLPDIQVIKELLGLEGPHALKQLSRLN